jgi:hypothetical protein
MQFPEWANADPNTTAARQFLRMVSGQPPAYDTFTPADLAAANAHSDVTLGVGATALAVAGKGLIRLTGDAGGNGITSITGGVDGQIVAIVFLDSKVNISTAAAKLNNNERYYGNQFDTLVLQYDGTNWEQIGSVRASCAPTAITLGVGAVAIDVTSVPAIGTLKTIKLTGDAGANSITSITGLASGETLQILFQDALVTITTTAAKLRGNGNYLSQNLDTMLFIYDGTNVHEVARKVNALPSVVTATPADPTGTASATLVMMGLAVAITPKLTGRVKVTVTGMMGNSVIGDGASAQISHGTGGAPANAAAVTGTQDGKLKNMIASTAAGKQAVALCTVITGLALNTAIWVDLALKAVTGGTASLYDLDVVVEEI